MNAIELRHKKQELLDEAIRNGGFYGSNGVWNSIKKFSGDDTIYRERVETIIIRNKEVFVKKRLDKTYFLPGGSTEKDLDNISQAINECREEARINVKNIQSSGITYKEKIQTPAWVKHECTVEWNGNVTEIYVAEYDSQYTGHIDDEDKDPFIKSGSFIPIKECFKLFRPEHREALFWYLKQKDQEDIVEESYVSNYFKNKKLLKKISSNPELSSSVTDQILHITKKRYNELKGKSKVQREIKSDEVTVVFYPCVTFDFPDENSITVAISFDTKEPSEGMAFHSEEFGDMVIVYPGFFKLDKNEQLFVLLHEIGHIRLGHLEEKNAYRNFFGKDVEEEHRIKAMKKGKAIYTEVNSDLYAILNGANMYSILNMGIQKDLDDKFDYRFTNQEFAQRYSKVFGDYNKLKKHTIRKNEGRVLESVENSLELESTINYHDIACLTIYDMIYESESTLNLTESEKNELYTIVYEFTIGKMVNSDPRVITALDKVKEKKEALKKLEDDNSRLMKINASNVALLSDDDKAFKKRMQDQQYEDLKKSGTGLASRIVGAKREKDHAETELAKIKGEVYSEIRSLKKAEDKEKLQKMIDKLTPKKQGRLADIVTERAFCESMCNEAISELYQKLSVKTERSETGEHIMMLLESVKEDDNIVYGIPETKSFPLDSKKHVLSAIRLFGHAEEQYRDKLADAIFKAMTKYGISPIMIGEKSKLRAYL